MLSKVSGSRCHHCVDVGRESLANFDAVWGTAAWMLPKSPRSSYRVSDESIPTPRGLGKSLPKHAPDITHLLPAAIPIPRDPFFVAEKPSLLGAFLGWFIPAHDRGPRAPARLDPHLLTSPQSFPDGLLFLRQDRYGWRRVNEAALSNSLSNRCLCAIGRCMPSYVWAPTAGILDRISTTTPRTKSSGQLRSQPVLDGSSGGSFVLMVGFFPESSRSLLVPGPEQEGRRIVAVWLEACFVLTPVTRVPSPTWGRAPLPAGDVHPVFSKKETTYIESVVPLTFWLTPCCDPPKAGSPHAVPRK